MTNAQDTIDKLKAEFLHAKNRMARALANTPDDRVNWSPAPSARTPAQVVAHAAMSVQNIQHMMDGTPFPIKATDAADKQFREDEQAHADRAKSRAVLAKASAEYVAWLDALSPERLDAKVEAPFGMGMFPVGQCIIFPGVQMDTHTAQIEYIQTIYGDRKW